MQSTTIPANSSNAYEAAGAALHSNLSIKRTLRVLVLPWIGLMGVFMPMLQILIPLQVEAIAPDDKVFILGAVVGIGSFFAALTNPIAGALSDHSGSRYGRRTPWLVGAALASFGALVLLGQANSLWALLGFFCLVSVTTNVYQANLTAVMPDRIPSPQRGIASAIIGVGLPLGAVVGSVLVSQFSGRIASAYAVLGGVMLLTMLIFVLSDREVPATKPQRIARTDDGTPRALSALMTYFTPFCHRNYTWTFLARCLCVLGEMLMSAFLLYMMQDFIHIDPGHTPAGVIAKLAPIGMGAMLVSAVFAGWLSDRTKRRVPFVATACVLLAIDCAVLYFFRDERGLQAFYIINGLAFGAFMAASQALSAEVLPDPSHMARDLGTMSISAAGAQVIAPMLGSFVINHLGSYVALLIVSAAVLVLAALSLLGIKGVR